MVAMDIQRIIEKLETLYSHKAAIELPAPDVTELVCEVEPASDHPHYSRSIVVIDQTKAHFHRKTREIYTVLKGKLTLWINGVKHELRQGQKMEIQPGEVHFAKGKETWIECFSEPGWTKEDHFVVEQVEAVAEKNISANSQK